MSENVTLNTFPSTKVQALTMLYLEKQDLTNLSPQDLVEKYLEIEKEIKTAFVNDRKEKKNFSY
ncbi:hypothetical protein HNQ80_003663 [Anaerosolibacter carboniphilus]|uniref:Uncharacterized protein n=1 Tax=Anaerosolibacter carboniphilus TaxID=1417629 RepID=A0A841L001_9FIRM|nr:hypothetical protein [Anaerosolibacter carboniphilus]MBB6217540.1 hypothetical protein [Anaerosolibacter carboniphilus]